MDNPDDAPVAMANPKPCAACPWRLANQGKEHPHKFYSAANLARLWKGVRSGARMSCHPTDPRMAEFEGYESCAERETVHECAGALIIQQREVMTFQEICAEPDIGKSALKAYAMRRSNGLTRVGLVAVVERAVLTWPGSVPMRRDFDLSDAEIGYPMIGRKK